MNRIMVALLLMTTSSLAKDNELWQSNPPEVQKWYRELMQPDYPQVSCCGEADAYWADSYEVKNGVIFAIITDERNIPNRPTIAPGTRVPVPDFKMKYDAGNPTGHGVLFLRMGREPTGELAFAVYCYVHPGGV